MYYEPGITPHGITHAPFKSCVIPLPIGWISTVNASVEELPHGVDEFKHAGLEKLPSHFVKPLRVKGSSDKALRASFDH